MVAILLAGLLGYHLFPERRCRRSPTRHPGLHTVPRCQSRRGELVDHRAPGAPFGHAGLKKMVPASSNGASPSRCSSNLALRSTWRSRMRRRQCVGSFLPAKLPYLRFPQGDPGDAPVLTLSLTSRVLPLPRSGPCGYPLAPRSRQISGSSRDDQRRARPRLRSRRTGALNSLACPWGLASALGNATVNHAKLNLDGRYQA